MHRAECIERRAAAALGADHVSPMEVVEFIIDQKPTIAKATWRMMKSSLMHRYRLAGTAAAALALHALANESSAGALKRGTTTSSLRKRHISDSDLAKCLSAIRATKSNFKNVLESWLVCGMAAGLRPHEWRHAEVVTLRPSDLSSFAIGPGKTAANEPRRFLRVLNSKATNGRAHGMYRHIDLINLPDDTISELARFASLMRQTNLEPDGYQRLYAGCSFLLRTVQSGKTGKKRKRIQLYSPRHQFTASAKQSMTHLELAAVLGHATDATAERHYGRRNHGSPSGVGVRPVVAETARVRQVRHDPPWQPAPTKRAALKRRVR